MLLILTVAGDRGILVNDLLDQSGVSRATLYRDVERIKRAGWRIDTEIDRGYATYVLAAWQVVPKLAPKAKPRAKKWAKPLTKPKRKH